MAKKTIEINKRRLETERKIFTLLQLAELAFGDDFDPDATYACMWYSPTTGQVGLIESDVKVRLSDGMVFVVTGVA